jgi:ABC-type multidrug transport system ATPase subunit
VLEAAGGVRALGLGKWYKGAKRAAVVNVQFGISESECFGLLGSNGAGKSTTIHILCGLHPPTSGTVLCGTENLDVRTDITTIQSAMGVCSQDNLLWDDLTGPEHLLFFARLRRVAPKAIKDHIDYWLRRVNLQRSADRRKYSRSYSGGMKRRLGVANAFIGNPKLVYLDEPSTGLDPESRQQLWRAVLAAKPGKSIILTTHALEEAEALCDRVGIMTFGLMRTLGTPTELRIRFDQGYKFMLACEVGKSAAEDAAVEDAADRYVSQLMPQARQVDRINGVLTYLVPKGAVAMSAIFKGMEESKASLQIKDWGLSHTSLEEVFLQIVAVSSLDRKG